MLLHTCSHIEFDTDNTSCTLVHPEGLFVTLFSREATYSVLSSWLENGMLADDEYLFLQTQVRDCTLPDTEADVTIATQIQHMRRRLDALEYLAEQMSAALQPEGRTAAEILADEGLEDEIDDQEGDDHPTLQ